MISCENMLCSYVNILFLIQISPTHSTIHWLFNYYCDGCQIVIFLIPSFLLNLLADILLRLTFPSPTLFTLSFIYMPMCSYFTRWVVIHDYQYLFLCLIVPDLAGTNPFSTALFVILTCPTILWAFPNFLI